MKSISTSQIGFSITFLILIFFVGQCLCQTSIPVRTVKSGIDQFQCEGVASEATFGNDTFVVAKFLGIPYAKSPDRFAKPVLQEPTDAIINATSLSPICQQAIDSTSSCQRAFPEMSEDCLYLNIYVPMPSMKPGDLTTQSPNTSEPAIDTTSTTTGTTAATPTTNVATTITPSGAAPLVTPTTSLNVNSLASGAIAPSESVPVTGTSPKTSTKPLVAATIITSKASAKSTTAKSTTVPTSATATPPTTIASATTATPPTITTSSTTVTSATTSTSATPAVKATVTSKRRKRQVNNNEPNTLEIPSANTKYAVLIYIHGGAYVEGSGNCYDGSKLAAVGGIIVVTINYRLGPFGFLSTNDGVIPGNLGLWDQHVAIQWVKEHIHHFGGDPDRITVGGQSAGSYSSIHQALYKENDQLFHRVIAQSGTPTAKKSVSSVGYATALEMAKIFHCGVSGSGKSAQIKNCLKDRTAEELANAHPPVMEPGTLPIQPTLDAPFAAVDPNEILSLAMWVDETTKPEVPDHFIEKDLLIGVDAQDGEVAYRLLLSSIAGGNNTLFFQLLSSPITPERFDEMVRLYFQSDYHDVIDDTIVEAVLDRYTNWENQSNAIVLSNRVVEMLTDIIFAIPVLDTASSHLFVKDASSKMSLAEKVSALRSSNRRKRVVDSVDQSSGGSTYVYRFNLPHTSESFKQNWLPWFEGTQHASELAYVFGWNSSFQEGDEGMKISRAIMKYWTNFVKTGDPNKSQLEGTTGASEQELPEWEEYKEPDRKYLEIKFTSGPETQSQLVASSRHFWSEYMPKLMKSLSEAEDPRECTPTLVTRTGNSASGISGGQLFPFIYALVMTVFFRFEWP